MVGIRRRIRLYIYLLSILLSVGMFFGITQTVPSGTLQTIKLTQMFALTSVAFLYVTLLISPITQICAWMPQKGLLIYARRALGVSAFYFGLLHAGNAFFWQLGGLVGLGFLSGKYLLAIGLSFIALIILMAMTATSFDGIERKLGHGRWKMLHRLVYLAGILVLTHALMLGTHFANLSDVIPQIIFLAVSFLLILETIRLDRWLEKTGKLRVRLGVSTTVAVVCIAWVTVSSFIPSGSPVSFGIHALHIQQANDAQLAPSGMSGDLSKRYTVSIDAADNVKPGQNTTLTFRVFDAASGNAVVLYQQVYEKLMHLIIVDSALVYYDHIHPEQQGNEFTVLTKFPKAGRYHLYIDFHPAGATEQQMAFILDVGHAEKPDVSLLQEDRELTKTFGDIVVTLEYSKPLKSAALSVGEQEMTFIVNDAATHAPVVELKPYLGAYGHLVMIHRDTYEYVHVHPTGQQPTFPDASGGPDVRFVPLGLHGPIKPGVYRVFAQFNPGGNLILADFTIRVE